MESSGGQTAAHINTVSSQHEQDLFNLGYPGFRLALSDFITDLGQPGSEPGSVRKAFQQIGAFQNQQFDTAEQAVPGAVGYQMTASGFRGDAQAQRDAAVKEALFSLEHRRRTNSAMLAAQESDTALKVRDFDMAQIEGLTMGGLNTSRAFTQNALEAAGYNKSNPWGGALSGAAGGAALGTSILPGWGTAAGAVVGGIAGYFGGGGG